ncbi:MAG: glycosyltransferase [Acidobacteriales bacterium]|nr:glycosyltransferase [Terriglobales bacterium]
MKITILGLSITSSWGNGHATTYRALARALHARGHDIVFFERDVEWYASNRDMPEPEFCTVHLYHDWDEVLPSVRRELQDADVAMVGSYFPDGIAASEEVLSSPAALKTFYDIDTPITVEHLRSGGADYLRRDQVPGFDLYFSFTGGPLLGTIEQEFGAKRAVPLYCSFDPDRHRTSAPDTGFKCDLSYMGTFAPDRQPKLEEFFCEPARRLPTRKFLLAGPQYPETLEWPRNVRHIPHLEPKLHPAFYSSSRFTLNLTRRDMVAAGYSPSVRLFEAAGSGAAILSDYWPGLETFFTPDEEILLPRSAEDVVRCLEHTSDEQVKHIAARAEARVAAEHSSLKRAEEFEKFVSEGSRTQSSALHSN